MTDIGTPTDDGMSVMPPLMNPSGPNYEKLNIDIPLEQPLIFDLDNAKAFYLPHESTSDENTHTPQGVVDTLTKERIYQQVNIRQGQSDMQIINMLFIKNGRQFDMSNTVLRFAGIDAGTAEISDDETFGKVQANLGRLTWRPSAVVAQTAGRYKTAHLVIENADRTKTLATLDFSLNIIANDVAYPRALAFYMSEYQRALFHIGQMQANADKQLNYLLNFEAAIVSDSLDRVATQIDDAIADADKKISDEMEKIDGFVSQSKSKLDSLNSDIGTAQDRMDKLDAQIKGDNLVTNDNLVPSVQTAINNGDIEFNINNLIFDQALSDRIDELSSLIVEDEKEASN